MASTKRGASDVSTMMSGISSRLSSLASFTVQCAWCGKVKRQGGYSGETGPIVHRIEGRTVSHGICPSCLESLVEDIRGSWDPTPTTIPQRGGFIARL